MVSQYRQSISLLRHLPDQFNGLPDLGPAVYKIADKNRLPFRMKVSRPAPHIPQGNQEVFQQ